MEEVPLGQVSHAVTVAPGTTCHSSKLGLDLIEADAQRRRQDLIGAGGVWMVDQIGGRWHTSPSLPLFIIYLSSIDVKIYLWQSLKLFPQSRQLRLIDGIGLPASSSFAIVTLFGSGRRHDGTCSAEHMTLTCRR
jgi:hypothetical protein